MSALQGQEGKVRHVLAGAQESSWSKHEITYPQFIHEAEEEGERAAALTFGQARDVEERHAALYKHALGAMLRDETQDFYVCQVCGYVTEREAPDQCPICNAARKKFRLVA